MTRDTIKVLEENIGRKLSDIPCSNIFTDMFPRARDTKERINKWDLSKIKENFIKIKRTNHLKKTYLPMKPQTRA